MTYKDYAKLIQEDLPPNEMILTDIQGYIIRMNSLRIKWVLYLADERDKLNEFEFVRAVLYKKKLREIKYDNDEKIDKNDVEKFILNDKEYAECMKQIHGIENCINLITEIIKSIDNSGYGINNILKHMIWASGGNA